MGIRNPGGGGAPAGAIGTGKTVYLSPTFIQNANGFFTNFAQATAYLNTQAGETVEYVIYPGTYTDKFNVPAVANATVIARGFADWQSRTILSQGMGANFAGAGAGNETLYIFNLNCLNTTGNHGADFYLDASANVITYTFVNCNFETNNAGKYGLLFDSFNITPANHRGNFQGCRFASTAGNAAFNDAGRHTSETTWTDCVFINRIQTGTQVNGRTYQFTRCTFQDFLDITVAVGSTLGANGILFERCIFSSYVKIASTTGKPDLRFEHCRMYADICGSVNKDAIWNFDNCVWENRGGEFTAITTNTTASIIWRLYNCTLQNCKIMLVDTFAATRMNVINCVIRNDQYGAVWADLAAGNAGITAYNTVSDVNVAAGVVVTGAGNQYPVAIG